MPGRVTGFWTLAGLVVVGIIIADIWIHPAGTNAVGNTLINVNKTSSNALLGKTS